MKFGRMMHNDKRQVPLEDESDQFIRPEVTKDFVFLYFINNSNDEGR